MLSQSHILKFASFLGRGGQDGMWVRMAADPPGGAQDGAVHLQLSWAGHQCTLSCLSGACVELP